MELASRAWYDKALNKVNGSLRGPELVKADQTLLVVLLLGLYEVGMSLCPLKARSLSESRPTLAIHLDR